MMLDRMEGNAELKTSVQQMLATRRLTHSVLLVGEAGLGTGFAARCIAADYLYPVGGAAAEALERATIHGEEYISVEELQQASGVGSSILDRLRQVGALGDLPESSQVSFF